MRSLPIANRLQSFGGRADPRHRQGTGHSLGGREDTGPGIGRAPGDRRQRRGEAVPDAPTRECPRHGPASRLQNPQEDPESGPGKDRARHGHRRGHRGTGAGRRRREAPEDGRAGGTFPGSDEPGNPGPDYGHRRGCHVGYQDFAGGRIYGLLRRQTLDRWRGPQRNRGYLGRSLHPRSLPMVRDLYHLQPGHGGFDKALRRNNRSPLWPGDVGSPGSELENPDRHRPAPRLRLFDDRTRFVLSAGLRDRGRDPPRGESHLDGSTPDPDRREESIYHRPLYPQCHGQILLEPIAERELDLERQSGYRRRRPLRRHYQFAPL